MNMHLKNWDLIWSLVGLVLFSGCIMCITFLIATPIIALFTISAFILEIVLCRYAETLGIIFPILIFFVSFFLSFLGFVPLDPYNMYHAEGYFLFLGTGLGYMLPFVAGLVFYMCVNTLRKIRKKKAVAKREI